MNLYELNQDIRDIEKALEEWAMEHEGDITEFPLLSQLDGLAGEKEEKILRIALWYKNLISDEKALKVEIDNLSARKKVAKNKAENLKNYLQQIVGQGDKIKDSKVAIGWRKSAIINLLMEPEKLPVEYQKITITADKAELKKLCKEAGKNDFAELVNKNNITIK